MALCVCVCFGGLEVASWSVFSDWHLSQGFGVGEQESGQTLPLLPSRGRGQSVYSLGSARDSWWGRGVFQDYVLTLC